MNNDKKTIPVLPAADLNEILSANTYPGRGIAAGLTKDGRYLEIAYFIMGRSANSRNRIFAETEDGIRTQAFDESKMEDPTLIIYRPVRRLGNNLIVTNGDQTDTIYDRLSEGGTFEDALNSRTFEEDPPNLTPRISLLVHLHEKPDCKLSILKSACGYAGGNVRIFYNYEPMLPGYGYFISTYQHDGNPLPSYAGEPLMIRMPEELDVWTDGLWQSLDENNKISLFTARYELATGKEEIRIINKHLL